MHGAILAAIVARLRRAQRIFVLTGAGLGVASGLPTFRGVGGYWNDRRVEELASPDGFASDPRATWQWYNERLAAYAGAEPNAGHRALAAMSALVPELTLATQNVDGLHLRAGSTGVIELHGDLRTLICTGCSIAEPLTGPLDLAHLQHSCGGLRRPNVVWFGEMLPRAAWDAAERASVQADAIIVAGTSAIVQPAASLARVGDDRVTLVEVNPQPALAGATELVLPIGTEVGLPAIVAALRAAAR